MVDLERTQSRRTRRSDLERTLPTASEISPDHFERLITLENDMERLNQCLPEMQQHQQSVMTSLAETSQRFIAHIEENKRMHQRMDEQDAHIAEMRRELLRIEKSLIELKAQLSTIIEFTAGIKRAAWISVSVFGVLLWWFVQKWLEMPR